MKSTASQIVLSLKSLLVMLLVLVQELTLHHLRAWAQQAVWLLLRLCLPLGQKLCFFKQKSIRGLLLPIAPQDHSAFLQKIRRRKKGCSVHLRMEPATPNDCLILLSTHSAPSVTQDASKDAPMEIEEHHHVDPPLVNEPPGDGAGSGPSVNITSFAGLGAANGVAVGAPPTAPLGAEALTLRTEAQKRTSVS